MYRIIPPCRVWQAGGEGQDKVEEDHRERSKQEREDEGEEEGGETQRRTWQLTDLTVLSSNKSICFQMGFGENNFRSPFALHSIANL